MCWYWWKRWRFAWAVGPGRSGNKSMRDGWGQWICVYGHLYFLIKKNEVNHVS